MLTGNALLIERFIPSTLMGLILGWIAYRTGSVLPGMVVHFVHNALLMLVAYYHDRITILGTGINSQAHLPVAWIVVATTVTGVCGLVIWWSTPPPAPARA